VTGTAWEEFNLRLSRETQVRLLLDYDGTMAEFAPTPDIIRKDPVLIELLQSLIGRGKYQVGVVSGRSLGALRTLLPLDGLLLAGTYGLEMRLPDGTIENAVEYDSIRPTMELAKPGWAELIDGEQGFYLEDKGWALALHAKLATEADAVRVLEAALEKIKDQPTDSRFVIERRKRFLEIYPREASKRRSINRILTRYTPHGVLPVFAGDDDHDEAAFPVVLAAGGTCIRVSAEPLETRAQFRLENPTQVRQWLMQLAKE